MFITVRFGDNRQEIFNPHCKICVLLDNIKERCDCQKDDIIDLSDGSGVRKKLNLNPTDYAIKHVEERDTLILIKIERLPGSLNDTCVPLLHDLLGDKDFLDNLNKKLKEEPNSQSLNEPDGRRPSEVSGRRSSQNFRKPKINMAVGGGKRKTTRSQSIATTGGTASFPKVSNRAR